MLLRLVFRFSFSKQIIEKLVPGAKFNKIYEQVVEFVKSKDESLVDKLTKNLGFVTGIEFREGSLLLNAKTTATVEKGMVFNVNVGFQVRCSVKVGLKP